MCISCWLRIIKSLFHKRTSKSLMQNIDLQWNENQAKAKNKRELVRIVHHSDIHERWKKALICWFCRNVFKQEEESDKRNPSSNNYWKIFPLRLLAYLGLERNIVFKRKSNWFGGGDKIKSVKVAVNQDDKYDNRRRQASIIHPQTQGQLLKDDKLNLLQLRWSAACTST